MVKYPLFERFYSSGVWWWHQVNRWGLSSPLQLKNANTLNKHIRWQMEYDQIKLAWSRIHWTEVFVACIILCEPGSTFMFRSNQSFNIPPPPGIWLFWKLSFKFPPTRAKMLFKCPTLGFIQVIKCPHPGDISNFPYYPLCRSSWSWSRVCRQVAIDSTVFILICSVTALW